jgi:hypothetical protein
MGYVHPSTISGITGPDVSKEQAVQEILPGIVVVDGHNYTSIQSAIDAAGKDRIVLISSAYTGTDSFRNPNNIRIFDLRRRFGLDASLWRNVSEWGAKLDARMVAGCSISSTTSLTCGSASFAPADAGKTLICYGCDASNGKGNNNLVTTISTVVSAHAVVLAATTGYTGSGRNIVYGTDDTTAFNAAITSFTGNGAPAALKYGKLSFCGMSIISNTLLFQNYGGEFAGCGWGSFSGNMGSKLIWAGASGLPMLNFQGGEGATVHDFQLFGNRTAMPIGIQVTHLGTDAYIGSYNTFEHLWLGAMFDGGPDILSGQPYNLQTGVWAHAPGGNADFQRFTTTVINSAQYGYDSDNGNATYWDWETLLVMNAKVGFHLVGDVHGRDWFFAHNDLDLAFGSSTYPNLTGRGVIDQFGVEGSTRMLTFVNGGAGSLVIHKGSWQAFTNNIINSGRIIDLQTAAGSDSLTLENFGFATAGLYSGPSFQLAFGCTGCGAAGQSVRFKNVSGITQRNVLIGRAAANYSGVTPPNVTFEWETAAGRGGTGEETHMLATAADNELSAYRKDFQGQINLIGGPLHVKRIGPPSNGHCLARGGQSTKSYAYRVSCLAGGQESTASPEALCSNGASLDSANYNFVSWSPMLGCEGYKVYGRTAGNEQYLDRVPQQVSHDTLGINYTHAGFEDDGTAIPNGLPPTVDSTGGAIVDGTLTVTDLNITGTMKGGSVSGCDLRHHPCRVAATGNLTGQAASIGRTPLFTTSRSGGQYRVSCSLSAVAAGTSGTVTVCVDYELPAGATTDCSNVIKLAEPGAHGSLSVVEWMRADSPVSYYTTVTANQGGKYQVGCSAEQEQ